MKNSKLIKILQAFTSMEIREFRKFIESPFFNKEGSYLIRYFDELKKGYPGFEDTESGKEILFKKLYPGKKYNDVTMRKLGSGILKLAEEFLKYKAFKENPDISNLLYIKKLRELRVDKLFESESALLDKKLSEIENAVDSDYFRSRYKLELEKINYYLDFNHLIKKQQDSLQAVQKYIVYDSLINLLDIGFNILVGSTSMYNSQTNPALRMLEKMDLESIALTLKQSSPELYPVYELFYKRYLGFKNFENDNSYYEYKNIAYNNMKYLTWENQFTIFISLQNICTRKYIEDKRYFADELHEVHKEMLSRGLYVQKKGDYMNIHTYRNIVLTASNLNKNEWVLEFMNKYLSKLLPEQQESLSVWTKALVYYNRKDYGKALSELQSVKNDHYLTKHDIKAMTMKMFYELNEIEPGISFAEAYRKMVTNDKTYAEIHRNSYSNFSSLFLKLIKLKSEPNTENAVFLKREIEDTVTNSKEWLLSKVNEIIV